MEKAQAGPDGAGLRFTPTLRLFAKVASLSRAAAQKISAVETMMTEQTWSKTRN
jgi:hypothetical protein